MKQQRRREIVTLVVVFVGVLLVSALAVYFVGNRGQAPEYTQVQQQDKGNENPVRGHRRRRRLARMKAFSTS